MKRWRVIDAVDPPARDLEPKSLSDVLAECEQTGWIVFTIVTTPWMFKVVAYQDERAK